MYCLQSRISIKFWSTKLRDSSTCLLLWFVVVALTLTIKSKRPSFIKYDWQRHTLKKIKTFRNTNEFFNSYVITSTFSIKPIHLLNDTLRSQKILRHSIIGREELMRDKQKYSLYHDNSNRRYEGMRMIGM